MQDGHLEEILSPSDRLSGKHIVLIRPADDAGETFLANLRAQGAQVSLLPLLDIQLCPFTIEPGQTFDWLFFTSRNGVRGFYEGTEGKSLLTGDLPAAVVGPATARALIAYGREARFVPPGFNAREAAEAFASLHGCSGLQILWPCGDRAHPDLAHILTGAGMQVTPLVVYRTISRMELTASEQALLQSEVDMLVLTSPSAVEAFREITVRLALPLNRTAITCLGPRTQDAAQAAFGRVDALAEPSTLESLMEAIQGYYGSE